MSLPKTPFCVYCQKSGETELIKTCPDCQILTYCSRSCQLRHYPSHKTICRDIHYFLAASKYGPKVYSRKSKRSRIYHNICSLTYSPHYEGFENSSRSDARKIFARIQWLETIEELALQHNHYGAMEFYVNNLNPNMTYRFSHVGDPDDKCITISFLTEMGKLGEAYHLFQETLQDVYWDDFEMPPRLLATGLTLGFVVWDKIISCSESFDAFVLVLNQASCGTSAADLRKVDLVIDKIQRMVFGDVFKIWRADIVQSSIQKVIRILEVERPRMLAKLIDPCPPNEKEFYHYYHLKYAHRILHRIPWAVQYLDNNNDRVANPCLHGFGSVFKVSNEL